MTHKHDSAPNDGGSACVDDGTGTCRDCGVAMVECPECHGIGYHFNGCVDGDEDIKADALSAAADRTLARLLAADFIVDISCTTIPAPAVST